MPEKKILIVDDNDHIHAIFKEYFESHGYSAETAQNGLEGVDKYRTVKPDLVLMDMQMPVMNGYESSKGIRTLDPQAKILMVTGHPDDPLAVQCLREGYVNTIISKPFNLQNLFQVVNLTLAA
jgi:two-component system, chemotaxis family, chemotaxis protein CheY